MSRRDRGIGGAAGDAGAVTALDARVVVQRPGFRLDASLSVEPGEVVAVMGPSGAGKSTLLEVLAGLVPLDEGYVRSGARTLEAAPRPRVRTAPSRRGIVLLGQEPRLFPHLTAHANIVFGLRVHGADAPSAAIAAHDWLARVGLAGLDDRRPAELSGGQQQRVALARALATSPAAVLLDEPLTSLDTETAGDIRALLHDQLLATGTTAIVATHDAVDAVSLASRLVVLEDGLVTQTGAVRDVLAEPATRFTAAVAGLNRVVGSVSAGRWQQGRFTLDVARAVSGGQGAETFADGGEAAAVFAPGAVAVDRIGIDARTGAPHVEGGVRRGEWLARVTRLEPTPAGVRIRTADPEVAVDLSAGRVADLGIAPGMAVRLRVDSAAVRLIPLDPAPPQ
ncbi:sulfate/molybdate ABC transporter ATP-binding protein [Microbacterium allomyrinae]|uniref:ABC transporter ATP-binding protein n=1 Tax=Microbacterium allomyrinae TaxID=2830666 RepID=A0A9X1S2B2_9MICO|nr:ABC transporter ATP-binding protein [Microbacterium allomyrinae]MCC2031152.1 ABC transporter ATP-binding protein [Microbacterium allomyrinae]